VVTTSARKEFFPQEAAPFNPIIAKSDFLASPIEEFNILSSASAQY